jgi:hypothetical protein
MWAKRAITAGDGELNETLWKQGLTNQQVQMRRTTTRMQDMSDLQCQEIVSVFSGEADRVG